MTSHLGLLVLFSVCVGVVFGTLLRAEPRDQVRLAVQIAGGLVLGAYVAGWLLFAAFH